MGFGQNYGDKHAASAEWIKENLPRDLTLDDLNWTSDPTPWEDLENVYNCFGYVLDSKKFWQPNSIWGDIEGDERLYWPPELDQNPDQNTWINLYMQAARLKGFDSCDKNVPWDADHEKIVLIHHGGIFRHAAMQISANRWKSKLGIHSDFEHPLEWATRAFGKGTIFMRRVRRQRSLL